MRRILLVKTSSLGDVVHNLPVVADLRGTLGDVAIDWVVERSFSEVPALHPHVRRVIPCEIRRWRRTWTSGDTRREWREFVRELRAQTYDAIVDTQGLLKSAVIARIARGRRYGLDWCSSREPLRFLYDRVFSVPWSMHAVERNRRLCAQALGYRVIGPPDYGVRVDPLCAEWLPERPYAVMLHATSQASKLWPEERWTALGLRFAAVGCTCVFPWGNEAERVRAERLASILPRAVVPAPMALGELAQAMAGAVAVIGVDTGLTHLAAAMSIPVVGIYGTTDPAATGVYGSELAVNVGSSDGFPSVDDVVAALEKSGVVLGASGRSA